MQNQTTTRKIIVTSAFLLALGAGNQKLAQAAVFDGGVYSKDKVHAHTDLGSDQGEPQPSNFAFEQDRFSTAPVGKPLYVLGEDNKCYWGNFAYNKFEKALIVYTKSPLSADRCIYQKQLDSKPSGYSISAKMGGVCVPTLGVGDGSSTNWKLEETGSPVAFALCVEQTASYGDYFKKGSGDRQVAAESAAAPAVGTVAKQNVTDAAPAPASATGMGPSVQDANAPWQGGHIYRAGFPAVGSESDPEVLHIADAAPNLTQEPSVQGVSSGAPSAAHSTPTVAANAPAAAAMNVDPAPTTATAPASTSASTGGSAVIPDGIVTRSNEGVFTVQISSHPSKSDAEKEIETLKARGVEDTWIMQATVHGTTYYRVCTGHYASAKAARMAQPKVAAKSGVKSAFIQRVVDDRNPAAASQNN